MRRKPESPAEPSGHGVQHDRAVRIEHALGIARGAGGVAKDGAGVLFDHRPIEAGLLGRQQGLVTKRVHSAGLEIGLFGQADEGLELRQLRRDPIHHLRKARIEQQPRGPGVVQDVADLVFEQARIDRVQHGAEAGDGEKHLNVPVGVPGQGRHPVAGLNTQGDQGLGQSLRPASEFGIAIADDIALDRARDDLALAVVPRRVPKNGRGRQRLGLHQSRDHGARLPGAVFREP